MAGGAQRSQCKEGALWRAVKEKPGFTGGRRAACAKAQRCGKAVWCLKEQRSKGVVPKAGEVGKGWLRSLHLETLVGPGHG